MKGIIDHYIIEVDCLHEGNPIIGGVGANVFFDKSVALDDKNLLYNPNKFKKTNAKIIGAPSRLSKEVIDSGITKIFNVGDTVHFYWTSLQEDRLLESERLYGQTDERGGIKMRYVFRLPVERAICATKNNHIEVNDTFLLALPVMQDESELVTQSGIYIQSTVKPKPLLANIVKSNNFYPNKKVYYVPHSNSLLNVNGTEYYAMKEDDIFALDNNGTIVPLSDVILIKPIEPKEITSSGIIVPYATRHITYRGYVVMTGKDCKDLYIGQELMYEQFIAHLEYNGQDLLAIKKEFVALCYS